MKGYKKLEKQENLILIDWLTVTSKCDGVDSFKELLGLSGECWETKEAYMNGYPFRQTFQSINILYGGREDMGVCLTMSGQGCRDFETYGKNNWFDLLSYFADNSEDYHITRLDLAFDDHTGILDIDRLLDETDDHNYVSKSRWWMVQYGSQGTSLYFGSPRSDTRIRIYDKAMERGLTDGSHWIRVELQLRSGNAGAAVSELLRSQSIGRTFRGILANYLTFREPSADSNKSRWPIADFWEKLLDSAAAIRLWTAPGTEYNIFHLQEFLVRQCGGAIKCWSDLYGLDDLLEQIKLREVRLSPKYQKLINDKKLLE